MDISIVIVNWNTKDDLRAALESCFEHSGGLKVEVIVVDNGSSDGSVAMVEADFPHVALIANDDNRGYTAACNQGMSRAQGRYYLMLNSDAELTEGCLPELARVLDEHGDIATASAQLRYPDGSNQLTACRFPMLWAEMLPAKLTQRVHHLQMPETAPEGIVDVDWTFGACQMVRAETVAEIGMMDKRIFMWYDDAEWCRRMADAGCRRVVAIEADCIHKVHASADKVRAVKLNVMKSMSEFEYFRIHEGRLKTLLLWTTRTGYSLVKTLLMGLGHLATLGRIERLGGLLRLNAGRLWWHLRHFRRIVIDEPKTYRADDVG